MTCNVGVGQRRVEVLRRAYLDGKLAAYCDALRAAGSRVVAPPEYAMNAEAAADAARDNELYRLQRRQEVAA